MRLALDLLVVAVSCGEAGNQCGDTTAGSNAWFKDNSGGQTHP